MNNEIKVNKANKSLTFINNGIAFSQFGIADEILDLITNLQHQISLMKEDIREGKEINGELQQENKRLKEDLKGQENLTLSYCKSEQDYKSRCEKAIEMLKEIHKILPGTYNQLLIEITQTLNILQNGSDSQ